MELIPSEHPNEYSEKIFHSLVGLEKHKKDLLSTLEFLLDREHYDKWKKKHHPQGLKFLENFLTTPLVILSGEVGCGKTELANAVITPLAKKLKTKIISYETPSDIRGTGRVGEISARITIAFDQVKESLSRGNKYSVLIIDEADDLATSRSQNQAHHEDRAGLNVLIKQIDSLKHQHIAVILITNRESVLDSAVLRRAVLQLKFKRPGNEERTQLFCSLFPELNGNKPLLKELVEKSNREIPFSYSDLVQKIAKQSLFKAVLINEAFTAEMYLEILRNSEPTPLIT
jgi:SpoVK/Ycf46/Vps4 family AAA+-type ATPase